MKLYNNNKNKRIFQPVVNFTKKFNDNDFLSLTFYKKVLQYISCNFHYVHNVLKFESLLSICVKN